jgi:hypothetical protein
VPYLLAALIGVPVALAARWGLERARAARRLYLP